MSAHWFSEQASSFSGELLFCEKLAKYTWYRIGGEAQVLAIPKTLDDLKWLAQGIEATGLPHFIMGAGSNLLISDSGFPGVVIKVSKLNLELAAISGAHQVRLGTSVMISSFLRRAAQEGWGGLELLTGIPGTVGGAVAMNAGTHLGETKDRLVRVDAFSLTEKNPILRSFEKEQLHFSYRKNSFLEEGMLVYATVWQYLAEDPVTVKAKIDETLARRKATQPIDYPSCGSVFKNPLEKKISAWQVIDQLGLRGHRLGGAQISEMHSNFIINLGGALARDVYGLITLIKARALSEMGVEMHEEVKYLGQFLP